MESLEKRTNKICGFYISNWHLTVMLLPYIRDEIKNGRKIVTFLEENIEENVNILLQKLNLNEESFNSITNIDWKNKNILKYEDVKKEINNIKNDITILVCGKEDYIEKVNESIKRVLKNSNISNLKIINCYNVTNLDKNMNRILERYNKILNTAGEHNINNFLIENNKGSRIS